MTDFKNAITDQIISDVTLSPLLDDLSGIPAIFYRSSPGDYEASEKPHVIIRPPTVWEDKVVLNAARQSDFLNSISIFAKYPNNSNDTSAVDAVAFKIYELFRLQAFTSSDDVHYQCQVSKPIESPVTDPRMFGLLLQLRLFIIEG